MPTRAPSAGSPEAQGWRTQDGATGCAARALRPAFEQPIYGASRAQIGPLIEKRGVDLGCRLIDEALAVQRGHHCLALGGGERPRTFALHARADAVRERFRCREGTRGGGTRQ